MKTYIIASAALAAMLVSSGALAWDQEPFAMYFQRSDTVTLGAGNARDVNAATHIIDPWPRNVGNRRIPGNGDRLSRAVERYRQGSYRQPAPPMYNSIGAAGGAGIGGGPGGGGVGGGGVAGGGAGSGGASSGGGAMPQ
jgi:hypothetical protein